MGLTGVWSLPYPDYLGAEYVHLGMLTYPPEGASVQITIQAGSNTVADETINIPAGSAPVALNVSCPRCYETNNALTVYAAYVSAPSTSVVLDPDNLLITSFQVDYPIFNMYDPAHITASFSGTVVGDMYSMDLWFNAPAMVVVTPILADDAELSADYHAFPWQCSTNRYMIMRSADGIHMAVATNNS